MQLVFLGIVFLVIVILLALKRPLYQAILGALIAAALLYRIPPRAMLSQTARVFTDWNSFSVLVSLYLITYLQRMLEARSQIKLAQLDLNGLFHNRRVNAAGAPLFIGLLPSAAAISSPRWNFSSPSMGCSRKPKGEESQPATGVV